MAQLPVSVEACRHLCQEARVILTSLRGGPPHVARGDLAQDLMDLRTSVDRVIGAAAVHSEKDGSSGAPKKASPIVVSEPPIVTPVTGLPLQPEPPRMTNPYARPFLRVIMDPRAAGPHTLVTLRAVHRLLQQGTLQAFSVTATELCVGILACKFEQTDAGADEAVEMAIADVLQLIVADNTLPAPIFIDAFNTVFVTRHTFLHSPALAYHFEDVLTHMVTTTFGSNNSNVSVQVALMEFLVNQLLHTPLVGGDVMDESTREARMANDDTRTVCLRLVRRALRTRFGNETTLQNCNVEENSTGTERTLTQIIKDDLCLSLLITGQAIWAYSQDSAAVPPGFVSLEVLSEICAVFAVLWNTVSLRTNLIAQFETILTGFYTRALVLLRQRKQPVNVTSFHANMIFDAEVEIILESLVDLLCLHNHGSTIADGDGGSLETMFSYYDCHLRRSDVATSLFVELSRCCGGTVNAEGEAIIFSASSSRRGSSRGGPDGESVGLGLEDEEQSNDPMVKVDHPVRPVPAHLKELCAQALAGGMKCLFHDDHASAQTLLERSQRKRSIMLRQMESSYIGDDYDGDDYDVSETHHLRNLKSKKHLMCKAARIFNKKSSRGIEFLMDSGLVSNSITPSEMAAFLRNGLVVGLDKKAVGAYLGEVGKAPIAGKSPPCWERDWFHRDVLNIYCSLFRFEGQSLLDGLRMFLATFRLPGESQQIDRILQAFADRCSHVCEESKQGIFSSDPKRASDAAYLLSFSIIMLNTDRHNTNIREDRKMSCDDFIKNNSDYGRDITEKGKDFPREYLATIYDSINDEEIRTEGEGADGAMTVERWKDVLRGSTDEVEELSFSHHDAEDLTELVLEHVWKPIVSAIGALWDVTISRSQFLETVSHPAETAHGNLLGVQGARLGMDMALEMLNGVCQLGRIDIFRKIFIGICEYTGLLNEYTEGAVERASAFSNSLESQAAVIVIMRIATEFGENLDEECWKRVWSIVFELRDLKLISRGAGQKCLLRESDPDFLNEVARMEWTVCLEKGDMDYNSRAGEVKPKEKAGLFSAFGRALFGRGDSGERSDKSDRVDKSTLEHSAHEKEMMVIWDENAPSDNERDEDCEVIAADSLTESEYSVSEQAGLSPTAGTQFESLLIQENMDMNRQMDMPVTGLERMDETKQLHMSPRARVRERLRKSCDLATLVSESRFMDDASIHNLLRSLISLISLVSDPLPFLRDVASAEDKFERCSSDISVSTTSITAIPWYVPISPASEAFAEVLLCELALKNKDRMNAIWTEVLQDHYLSRLTSILVNPGEGLAATKIPVDPGLEKRVTGLLRLTVSAIKRQELANEVLSAWKYLLPVNDEQHASSPLRALDRHIGEGLWRIAAEVDSLGANLNDDGWEGLMSLLSWCAKRGGALKPISKQGPSGLPEDDPALQCYRSLHLLLNSNGLDEKIPCSVVWSLRCLIAAGGRRNYAQLSIASLDLLDTLHGKKLRAAEKRIEALPDGAIADPFWSTCWRKIVEGIAEAAELSVDTVRKSVEQLLTISAIIDVRLTCHLGLDCAEHTTTRSFDSYGPFLTQTRNRHTR